MDDSIVELIDPLVELIRRASTQLPPDMRQALRDAAGNEVPGSAAQNALQTILLNLDLAERNSTPICQDTGTPLFKVLHPVGLSTLRLTEQIRQAVAIATRQTYLRPNAVDSVSGTNSGDNAGRGFPITHFCEWDRSAIQIDLLLKGGGCENVSAQYSLPDGRLGAERNLDGVRRIVLDAVYQAQGRGCAPGVLGVAIGGDRGSGYVKAKEQLFRRLDDTNAEPRLADLEARINREANQMGIGPMGFGGNTTVLGVKIGALHRLPACYFVSVAYMCWANRHASMKVSLDGKRSEARYA